MVGLWVMGTVGDGTVGDGTVGYRDHKNGDCRQ